EFPGTGAGRVAAPYSRGPPGISLQVAPRRRCRGAESRRSPLHHPRPAARARSINLWNAAIQVSKHPEWNGDLRLVIRDSSWPLEFDLRTLTPCAFRKYIAQYPLP